MPMSTPDSTEYKKALKALAERVTAMDFATRVGVSVDLVRQSTLPATARAFRSPPKEWRKAALALAEKQAKHFLSLARALEKAK